MSPLRHAIWDWNGTLLDDFEITAQITIAALSELGAPDVTVEAVRDNYRRPLRDYFSTLLGREATEEDLSHLSSRYNTRYQLAMRALPLAADAVEALETIGQEASQSLLSMAPDAQLHALVDHHGLRAKFILVQGHRGGGHPSKRQSLVEHCGALGISAAESCLIGDTVDDCDAAAALGMSCILVTTGMQSRRRLENTGAPVVDSLREAAALFLNRLHQHLPCP